jgi:D-alanyl-D-alanine carboxypeptidase
VSGWLRTVAHAVALCLLFTVAGTNNERVDVAQAAVSTALHGARATHGNARSTESIRALQRALRSVAEGPGVGVVAAVRSPGLRWQGAAGSRQLDPVRSATPEAQFVAASIMKLLIAVVALHFVETEQWSLDTTIGDIAPALWPEHEDVTVSQLLSHTSGMPDMIKPLLGRRETPRKFVRKVSQHYSDDDLIRAAKRERWLFDPGSDFSYSNTNYVVLGIMLRALTGRSVRALLTDLVFRPSGMHGSYVQRRPGLPPGSLHEYMTWTDGHLVDVGAADPSVFSHAASLVTTVGDLNRFDKELSRGKLIGPKMVHAMRTVVASDYLEYGLGTFRLKDPCRRHGYMWGHDGLSWGTVSLTMSSPDGRRRVSLAMTGRQIGYDGPPPELRDLAAEAMKATCSRPRGGAIRAWLGTAPE